MLFLRIRGATVRVENKKKLAICVIFILYFCKFWPNKKYFGKQKVRDHPHTMGYVCGNFRISTIFGF